MGYEKFHLYGTECDWAVDWPQALIEVIYCPTCRAKSSAHVRIVVSVPLQSYVTGRNQVSITGIISPECLLNHFLIDENQSSPQATDHPDWLTAGGTGVEKGMEIYNKQ